MKPRALNPVRSLAVCDLTARQKMRAGNAAVIDRGYEEGAFVPIFTDEAGAGGVAGSAFHDGWTDTVDGGGGGTREACEPSPTSSWG